MNIETRLADFLRREGGLPPYPGACCKMADRWVALVTGISPLEHYGRNFETDAEVQAWLAEPGGIAVAVNRVMRASSFAKAKAPRIGDVGLVIHGERAGEHGDSGPERLAFAQCGRANVVARRNSLEGVGDMRWGRLNFTGDDYGLAAQGVVRTGFIEGAIFALLTSSAATIGLAGSAAVIAGLTGLVTIGFSYLSSSCLRLGNLSRMTCRLRSRARPPHVSVTTAE